MIKLRCCFIPCYERISDILRDKGLAALGDAYVNFIFSLSLSKRLGRPVGRKVDSRILSDALKNAGLRRLLPSRIDRHDQADAAEALIVYAWIEGKITMDECVDLLGSNVDPREGFKRLLKEILERIDLDGEC